MNERSPAVTVKPCPTGAVAPRPTLAVPPSAARIATQHAATTIVAFFRGCRTRNRPASTHGLLFLKTLPAFPRSIFRLLLFGGRDAAVSAHVPCLITRWWRRALLGTFCGS